MPSAAPRGGRSAAPGNASRSTYRSTPSEPSGFVNGTGLIAGGSRLPGFISASCWTLSPSSGTQPLR